MHQYLVAFQSIAARAGPAWPGCPPGRRSVGSRRGRGPLAWGGARAGGRTAVRASGCRRSVTCWTVAAQRWPLASRDAAGDRRSGLAGQHCWLHPRERLPSDLAAELQNAAVPPSAARFC